MFMCQRNPVLTNFSTKVISCKPFDNSNINNPVKEEFNGVGNIFEVILEDTILFPEGGGQPDDHGFINKNEVIRVVRNGTKAIHFVKASSSSDSSDLGKDLFQEDETVDLELNWERRFDHMQQHSGQHLITAIADKIYGFQTTSWWLGTRGSTSYIELDTKDISEVQMKNIENEVNSKIRDGVPVTVDVVALDDPKLKTARGRNLPEDVKGQIRIVTIQGVENNVCCGTHVSSLNQLQVVKLLFVEKKKGKCLLHFLVGDRVINTIGEMFHREQALCQRLNSPASDLVQAAEKLNISLKSSKKLGDTLCKDLAKLEAKTFLNSIETISSERIWHYHRDNVELDFATALLREIGVTKNIIILVTLKVDNNSGHLLLRNAEDVLSLEDFVKLSEELCTLLNGKGTLRGNLYQAKISNVNNIKKALKIGKEFIASNFKNVL